MVMISADVIYSHDIFATEYTEKYQRKNSKNSVLSVAKVFSQNYLYYIVLFNQTAFFKTFQVKH
jgi:hypothetical protein